MNFYAKQQTVLHLTTSNASNQVHCLDVGCSFTISKTPRRKLLIIVFPAAFHVVGWITALLQCLIMRNYSSISDKKYHMDALRQHAARVSTSKAWPQHWKKQVLTVTSTTDFPLCPTENPKS